MNHLEIAIAEDEPLTRQFLKALLEQLGHKVVIEAENGRDLVEKCHAHRPQLIITDIKMPQLDGISAAREIYSQAPLPVILVSAHHEPELVTRAETEHVMAYLVKPVKQSDLEPAIAIAIRRFEQFQSLRQEAENLRQALSDRKIIEKAKGILMRKTNLNEHEAFRRLQKLARDNSRKLVDIANMIITAEAALSPPEDSTLNSKPDSNIQ